VSTLPAEMGYFHIFFMFLFQTMQSIVLYAEPVSGKIFIHKEVFVMVWNYRSEGTNYPEFSNLCKPDVWKSNVVCSKLRLP
jgi:hypothetical protein